jgi:hypothetical protein
MRNGLEFAGGLRESADLRKYNVTPARTPENEYEPDGPLTLFSRSATTADGKFTAWIFGYPDKLPLSLILVGSCQGNSKHSEKVEYRDTWFYPV